MKTRSFLLMLGSLLFSIGVAFATPVDADQARTAVGCWLRRSPAFASRPGVVIDSVRTCETTNGVLFHVVRLRGGGFAVTSADTRLEPVVAFSDSGDLAESADNPLWSLINADFAARGARLSESSSPGTRNLKLSSKTVRATTPEERRWEKLLGSGNGGPGLLAAASDPAPFSDVRVAPLVKSLWGQKKNSYYSNRGELCYNFFTPKNRACGCVAAAMAQLIRYHRYPERCAKVTETCGLGDASISLETSGETYDYDLMKLVPEASPNAPVYDGGATEAERKAIGRLTADCSISLRTTWEDGESGQGNARGYVSHIPLANVFKYASAKSSIDEEKLATEEFRARVIYSNLDAGYPVILGVTRNGASSGHEVVADGYGYSDGVAFTHLNLGWDGMDNAWYALPDIAASTLSVSYDVLNHAVYNVFPEQTGEIISGRVVDEAGNPIKEANIKIEQGNKVVQMLKSDANGVFGVVVAPEQTYFVTVSFGSSSRMVNATVDHSEGSDIDMNGFFSIKGSICGNVRLGDIVLNEVRSVELPTVVPGSCLFYPSTNVTVTCATPDATIRYTLDGSDPDESSAIYAGPILVEDDVVLKVRAFKNKMNPSAIASAKYTLRALPGVWTEDADRARISAAEDGRLVCVMLTDGLGGSSFDEAERTRSFTDWAAANGIYLVECVYDSFWTSPAADWFLDLYASAGLSGIYPGQMYFAKPDAPDFAIGAGWPIISGGYLDHWQIGDVAWDGTIAGFANGFASVLKTATPYGPADAGHVLGVSGLTWCNDSSVLWEEAYPGQMRTGGYGSKSYTSTLKATIPGWGKFRFSYRACVCSYKNEITISVNGQTKKTIGYTWTDHAVDTMEIEANGGETTIEWTYKVVEPQYDYSSQYAYEGKSVWCGIWLSDVTWTPGPEPVGPFPSVTPQPGETEGAAVARVLSDTFGTDSEIVRNVTDQAKLAELNDFLKRCGIRTPDALTEVQKRHAYPSFVLASVLKTPMLLTEEPKLTISSLGDGAGRSSGFDMTISLDAGKGVNAMMVAERLKSMIRVGTSVDDISGSPTILSVPTEDGSSLTFTVAKPDSDKGFFRVQVIR